MSVLEDYNQIRHQRTEILKQAQEERTRHERLYRMVFDSQEGREVLADILNDLGFWSKEVQDSGDVVLQNYARLLLEKCGAWHADNIPAIIDSILGGMPREELENVRRSDGD